MLKRAASPWWMVVLLAASTQAGAEIRLEERALPGQVATEQMRLLSQGRRLAMESRESGSEAPAGGMLFDGERREMIVITHQDRSFMRIDEKGAEETGSQISAAMEQMRAQLSKLPPEQRAMAEKMMAQRMPAMAPAKTAPATVYRRSTERAEKAGHPCTRVDVLRADELVRVHWVTDRDELELAEETFELLGEAAAFTKSLARSFGSGAQGDNPLEALDELGGFPVVSVRYENGKPVSETVLVSAARRDVTAKELSVPEGYRERRMPTPGAKGRR